MPGFGNVVGPIRDALARYPIDPDRVHIRGSLKEERLNFVKPVEFRAELGANEIRLTTSHVTECRIYLSDRMADLDQEIIVVVNGGKPARRKAERSVSVLLQSAVRDRGMTFEAAIDIKIR